MSVSLLNGLDNYGNLAELFGGNEASRPDPNLDLLSPEANSTDPNAAGARAQTASGITATAGGDFGGNAGGGRGYNGGGYSGGFSRNNFPPPPSGSGRGQLLDIAA